MEWPFSNRLTNLPKIRQSLQLLLLSRQLVSRDFSKTLASQFFRSLDSVAKYALRALRVLSLRRQSDIVARSCRASKKLESGRLADAGFRRARNLRRSSFLQFDTRFNSCHQYLYGRCCRQVLKISKKFKCPKKS